MPEKTKEQVLDQFRVVVHLAGAIKEVYEARIEMHSSWGKMSAPILVEFLGEQSAQAMEALGNIVNGMDAVDEDDAWTGPIFEAALELWPRSRHDR